MKRHVASRRLAGFVIGAALSLGGCGHQDEIPAAADSTGANAYPANYKAEILAGMHAYLNDPTGIRDAALAPPALKTVGGSSGYVACVQFNAKKNATQYAGVRTVAAVFLGGRLDRI